ncbi:MAG: hypothetical protein M4579_000445 [Chaenotheca gracillima]|nr:MAG: hypothetical protein M4579_000445 [Chaenotheca gracillima]
MHNKADLQAQNGVVPRAWAYIGSANISESAWGRLVQDKTTKKPKLNCRNWECGVVIPTSSVAGQSAQASVAAAVGMDVFQGSLPVPMDVPGEQYGSRIPWYNNEYHP